VIVAANCDTQVEEPILPRPFALALTAGARVGRSLWLFGGCDFGQRARCSGRWCVARRGSLRNRTRCGCSFCSQRISKWHAAYWEAGRARRHLASARWTWFPVVLFVRA